LSWGFFVRRSNRCGFNRLRPRAIGSRHANQKAMTPTVVILLWLGATLLLSLHFDRRRTERDWPAEENSAAAGFKKCWAAVLKRHTPSHR